MEGEKSPSFFINLNMFSLQAPDFFYVIDYKSAIDLYNKMLFDIRCKLVLQHDFDVIRNFTSVFDAIGNNDMVEMTVPRRSLTTTAILLASLQQLVLKKNVIIFSSNMSSCFCNIRTLVAYLQYMNLKAYKVKQNRLRVGNNYTVCSTINNDSIKGVNWDVGIFDTPVSSNNTNFWQMEKCIAQFQTNNIKIFHDF